MTDEKGNGEHVNTKWYIDAKEFMDSECPAATTREKIAAKFFGIPAEILDKLFAPEAPEPAPDR